MDGGDSEKIIRALDSCLPRIKWRLRHPARRRLETDILALCGGLRAVVLVDYGGRMPELQERLLALFSLLREESAILLSLRLMVIQDMIYMIHAKGLAELASSSLRWESNLLLVDLEQDPPEMLLHSEHNILSSEFLSVQKLFSAKFLVDVGIDLLANSHPSMLMVEPSDCKDVDQSVASDHTVFQPSEMIDLTSIMDDSQITLPTVNGWLLGYPVVYLFSKDNAHDAICRLSTKPIHIYKIIVTRNQTSNRKPCEEEVMSFTVPGSLSIKQEKEPWAEAFLTRMLAKFEKCRQVWGSMRLEVSEGSSQASIVL